MPVVNWIRRNRRKGQVLDGRHRRAPGSPGGLEGPEFWDDRVVSASRPFAGVGETDAILTELAGRLADTREQTITHDAPALEEVLTDSAPVENVPRSTGPGSPPYPCRSQSSDGQSARERSPPKRTDAATRRRLATSVTTASTSSAI